MAKSGAFAYTHIKIIPDSFKWSEDERILEASFGIAPPHQKVLRLVPNLRIDDGEFIRQEDGVVTLRYRPTGDRACDIVTSARGNTPRGQQYAAFECLIDILGDFKGSGGYVMERSEAPTPA